MAQSIHTNRQESPLRGSAEDIHSVQRTTCCIAGGGPAGVMLGYMLARQGIEVIVFEKHADFLRDFRGDTLHPSTMEIMDQLGLAEGLLGLPHNKAPRLKVRTPQGEATFADFSRLKTRYPYITFMPQWDFLDFLTDEAKRYPGFSVEMNAEVLELIEEGGVIRGVRYQRPEGDVHEVRAELIVAADGRSSVVRDRSGLELLATSPPIDVLWFRLSRRDDDPEEPLGHVGEGRFLISINRGDYWQMAYVIPKGADKRVRAAGLEAFRQSVAQAAPELSDRVEEIEDWEQVKLLSVQTNRLRRWYRPRLLCIGDAAHAMSPVGGVGINLAIQDAVVAANVVGPRLGSAGQSHAGSARLSAALASVQRRREVPTRIIQRLQAIAQRRVAVPAIGSGTAPPLPALVGRMAPSILRLRVLRDLPTRLIAFGVWPVRVAQHEQERPEKHANQVEQIVD